MEADYKSFGQHLEDYKEAGLPIDVALLTELAIKYNCPLPNSKEWFEAGFDKL